MIVAGVLSGTSVDGIDVGIVRIEQIHGRIHLEKLHFETAAYSEQTRTRIFRTFQEATTAQELCQLNFAIAEEFATAIVKAVEHAGLSLKQIELIGSHGQTIWHDVDYRSGRVGSTLQIGEAAVITQRTGITCVSNFRCRDVACGGQGAPLTST
jgi:anhydro-N-acetylmuramic acid kinase